MISLFTSIDQTISTVFCFFFDELTLTPSFIWVTSSASSRISCCSLWNFCWGVSLAPTSPVCQTKTYTCVLKLPVWQRTETERIRSKLVKHLHTYQFVFGLVWNIITCPPSFADSVRKIYVVGCQRLSLETFVCVWGTNINFFYAFYIFFFLSQTKFKMH